MSQPRMRKVMDGVDERPQARASVAKASGDSVACTVRPNQETLRSRSKNKIPKSVRYDLENALVGLCDVWFEEIKPHLVRNNIKLHVHGSSAGGDHELPPPPARTTPPAPPAPPAFPAPLAPGCSHLDPASSAPNCELCRLLFNAANCIESAVCQAAHAQPSPPVAAAVSAADSSRLHSVKNLERPRTRRKHRRSKPQPKPSWRVPRLCRTYSMLCPAATGSRMRRIASHPPPQPPRTDYYRFIVPRRGSVMKNKATQTEQALLCESKGCQWEAPGLSRSRASCSQSLRSPTPHSPTRRYPTPYSPGSHSPGTSTPLYLNMQNSTRVSPGLRNRISSISASCNPGPGSHDRASPTLSLPRHIYLLKRPEPTATEEPPLFQDDLINIIGERNDKRLRLLYSSPEGDDNPSFMNLFPLPNDRQGKPGGLKKFPPWR